VREKESGCGGWVEESEREREREKA